MVEKEDLLKSLENLSREQLIVEIKELENQLDIGRQQFFKLEQRIMEKSQEIEFLRQVVLNLTKK